ncbi:MAG: hypothetical protein RIR06_1831 [Bacteroidota bacterium]|jgi:hypothetical protein
MKKPLALFGAILTASIIFMSCGGSSDSLKLTIEKAPISGDAKDYIEVVPGDYEVKKNKGTLGDELQLSLKLRVLKSYDQEKIGDYTGIGNLNVQITDQSGAPINLTFSPAGGSDWDKINSLLKGKPGDEVTVLFNSSGFSDENAIKEVLEKGKGLELTRADVTNPKTEPIIDNSTTSSASAAGDCEQFCSDYEAFADEYVAFMKKYKANPSDASIISEYSEMLSRAAQMQQSSMDCTADAKAVSRINQAIAKIAKAAM